MSTISTLKDILRFAIKKRKKWLIPFAILLVTIAVILVAAQGSVVAPFIYTLF
jgi:hypothetical protein